MIFVRRCLFLYSTKSDHSQIRGPPYQTKLCLFSFFKEVFKLDNSSNHYIPINGKLIPVTKELYDNYYKEARKELYQEEQAQENGVFSYDSLDNGRLLGAELFANPDDVPIEETIITKELHDLLHRCINALPRADRELINSLYYNNQSERSYAKETGNSKSGINYRHEQILSKLRILMKILGSF